MIKSSARRRIRALLDKGATDIHAIAAKVGVSVQHAQEERSRWRKQAYYASWNATYAKAPGAPTQTVCHLPKGVRGLANSWMRSSRCWQKVTAGARPPRSWGYRTT